MEELFELDDMFGDKPIDKKFVVKQKLKNFIWCDHAEYRMHKNVCVMNQKYEKFGTCEDCVKGNFVAKEKEADNLR